ncbi:hypothetical protein Tsubulata_013028, partial [Turnera subulata]
TNTTALTVAATATGKAKVTTLPLIHIDSVDSPFHKPGETTFERIKKSVERSHARIHELAGSNDGDDDDDDLQPVPIARNTQTKTFMVNFSIGDPPVSQLAFMDTGSPMLWLKCRDIQEPYPSYPIFNPRNSHTFRGLLCKNSSCPVVDCQPGVKYCPYTMSYLKPKVRSVGMYAFEQLTFYTIDGGMYKEEDILFGCSEMEENFDGDFRRNGIFGLSKRAGVNDLISQMGYQFSYCLGNVLYSNTYPYNSLSLDDGVKLQGPATPLALVEGVYYLTLQGISINGMMLDIDPNVFRRLPGGIVSGVVIDSGATLTFLTRAAYFTLKYELVPMIDDFVAHFHFADGVGLVFNESNLFYQNPLEFCLAISPTPTQRDVNLSIIGILAQQNYNVGYDLVNEKLYLDSIPDCESNYIII